MFYSSDYKSHISNAGQVKWGVFLTKSLFCGFCVTLIVHMFVNRQSAVQGLEVKAFQVPVRS